MIKATYTLDPDTVRALERMALRLGVSKSEALRRAIHTAAGSGARDDQLAALDQLQELMALTPATASAWVRSVRAERHASDRMQPQHAGTLAVRAPSVRQVAERPAKKRR